MKAPINWLKKYVDIDLNNIDSLEKFAREKYMHKKKNETILIIE